MTITKKSQAKPVKRIAAAASTLLLSSMLAACGSGGNDPAPGADAATTADPNAKQTVTVSVFTEDRFLKDAVDRFEQAHPNIDVQVQETVPTDTSGDKMRMQVGPDSGPPAGDIDKYVNAVGTALMSGSAADLISVNYLPADRYVDKGMFADWNEIAGKDGSFKTSDYYERVLKGISANGNWYAVPVNYSLDVMIGNKAEIAKSGDVDDKTWNWEQFVALCQQLASQTGADGSTLQVLGGMKPEDLLAYVTKTVYATLVTGQGGSAKFDEQAFRAYLEQVKKLYDSGAASADSLGKLQQVFGLMSMSQPMELALLPNMLGNGEGVVMNPPGSGEDKGLPFTSDLAFALNERSKVKPAAWEFVKFLLSEEMQSSPSMMAFPVHQAAAKTRLQEFAEKQKSGGAKMMIKGKDGSTKQLTITPEQIDAVLQLLPTVGKYEHKDDKVIGMIKEEAASFFSGGKSAEAVAQSVANRVNIYLNE